MKRSVLVKKSSGEYENFQIEKLIHSLRRAGANEVIVQDIAGKVQEQIEEEMSTKKIYQLAFNMLKAKSRVSASKYKLKKAIMELGPSGFPFEKFVGKLLANEGFATEVGVIVEGKCVSHEIDVIAQKDNKHYMIECKYHSDQGRVCNVKIPLYIQSRFLDVEQQWEHQKEHKEKFHKGGLFTNTRFTSDAIQYGKCVGLLLTSWDYPLDNGLKDRIDKAGLHPLTALTTLTKAEKTKLLDEGIVLCKELHESPSFLDKIGIDKTRLQKILEDSKELCKSH
ncbi:ATPase [Antarcticibacterium arcticum]|uniref:ATPase n=1 Tax=Antarcticibacterium arcticum TaxID=2585771 RepID=A0A5B8YGY0_9FLAO|nr:restriction endonuclease [Antarcticibacterium arcticum]QED37140.1 ATPase [Antarcticibacterium arcticum]